MDLTLGFIIEKNKILLGLKKRGFGVNKWAGFGGKVQAGEGIDDCMKREFKEEVGLDINDMAKVGVVQFKWQDKTDNFFVHVYRIKNYSGAIGESEEMKPVWFNISDIPLAQMWPDNAIWFPYLLQDKFFVGKFIYNADDNIVEYNINQGK